MSRYGRENLPIPTPGRLKRDLLLPRPPFWMVATVAIAVVLSLVPIALLLKARVSKSELPKFRILQDMGVQPRYEPQAASDVFADGRAMRPPVRGTVGRDLPRRRADAFRIDPQLVLEADLLTDDVRLREDDHYYRGYEVVEDEEGNRRRRFYEAMPDRVTVDLDFLKRGRSQYNIHCAVCHGYDGRGGGMVHRVASDLETPGWLAPRNLLESFSTEDEQTGQTVYRLALGREEYRDGRMYAAINLGVRTAAGYTMPPMGPQISVEDRWAIVAYVRALQRAGWAQRDDLTEEERERLEQVEQQ